MSSPWTIPDTNEARDQTRPLATAPILVRYSRQTAPIRSSTPLPYGNLDGHVGWNGLERYFNRILTDYAWRYYGRDQNPQIVVGRQSQERTSSRTSVVVRSCQLAELGTRTLLASPFRGRRGAYSRNPALAKARRHLVASSSPKMISESAGAVSQSSRSSSLSSCCAPSPNSRAQRERGSAPGRAPATSRRRALRDATRRRSPRRWCRPHSRRCEGRSRGHHQEEHSSHESIAPGKCFPNASSMPKRVPSWFESRGWFRWHGR